MKMFEITYLTSAVKRAARKGRISKDQALRLVVSLPARRARAYRANDFRAHQFLVLDVVAGIRRDRDYEAARLLIGKSGE